MTPYEVELGRLTVGGQPVDLPLPVGDLVEVAQGVVVLLKVGPHHRDNRNVILVDEKGEVVWRIQESPHGCQADKPFIRLAVEGGRVVAGNWNGVDYEVSLATGEIHACGFPR